jgi:hypothetical protein
VVGVGLLGSLAHHWFERRWSRFEHVEHPVGSLAAAPSSVESVGSASVSAGVGGSGRAVDPPFPVGWSGRGNRVTVSMSDGTIRTEADGKVIRVTRGFIEIDGQRMYLKSRYWVDAAKAVDRPVQPVASGVPSPEPSSVPSSAPSLVGQVLGDWRLDPDGVYRLTNPPVGYGGKY